MDISRSALETWFNRYHPGVRFDLGGTMVPAPQERFGALLRPEHFDTRYPPTDGASEVRALLAAADELEAEDLVLTCGATEANAAALWAGVRPGSVVVIQDPLYYQFEPLVRAAGATVRHWDPFGGGGMPDLASGRGSDPPIGPDTCLVVLNSPHNPTGRVVDVEPVVRLAEALPDCRILVDEVYRGVTVMGPPTAAGLSDRVVTTSSFAKRWGMPGLRLGWIACKDPAFRERALAWHEHLAHSPPGSSERVVAGLWPELQTAVRESQEIASRGRAMFASWLVQMRDLVEGTEPETGVCTILRPRYAGYDGDDRALALRLRHEFELFVLPGSCVGYPGWVRVGFGHRNGSDLVAALARLETGLGALAADAARAVARARVEAGERDQF